MSRATFLIALAALLSGPAAAQSVAAAGQSQGDFRSWRGAGDRSARIAAFERYLDRYGVGGVIPTWQLLRTSSSWQGCRAEPFVVAPPALWPNIAQTLRYVRDVVKPAIGAVEVMSGYRYPELNACSHGAPGSAHARFRALDLVPKSSIGRRALIARICALHAATGARWRVGLGFYSGTRFHVDTARFRRWGGDGRGATSPCVTQLPPRLG